MLRDLRTSAISPRGGFGDVSGLNPRRSTGNHAHVGDFGSFIAATYAVVAILISLSSAIHFGQATRAGVAFFDNPLKPSFFYFFTYSTAVALLILRRGVRTDGVARSLIFFFVAYGTLHIFWLPFMGSLDEVAARTLVMRLNTAVMSICFIVIMASVINLRAIVLTTQFVVLATCALNLVVVLAPEMIPIRMSSVPGRAAGLYWDANQCATILALSLPLVCLNARMAVRLCFYAIIFVGILFTFSRGGLLLWVLVVVCDIILKPGTRIQNRTQIAFNASLFLLGGFLLAIFLSAIYQPLLDILRPYLTADTFARLSGTDRGSGAERLTVMTMGLEVFFASPFIGSGFSATRAWAYIVSVHNMFLLMLAEFGVVGGLLYGYYITSLARIKSNFGLVIAPLVIIISMFTHSLFDISYYNLLFVLYWRVARMTEESRTSTPLQGSCLQELKPSAVA